MEADNRGLGEDLATALTIQFKRPPEGGPETLFGSIYLF
jgi:hypothetical protein